MRMMEGRDGDRIRIVDGLRKTACCVMIVFMRWGDTGRKDRAIKYRVDRKLVIRSR